MNALQSLLLRAIPALATAALPVAAQAADDGSLATRVEALERAVRQLETVPAAAPQPAAGADEGEALRARIDTLDQAVRVVGRKLELEQEAIAARQKDSAAVSAGRDGFALRSGDGAFRLRIGGVVQADARAFVATDPAVAAASLDNFYLRRVRPVFEGTFAERFGFLIRPEFGNEGKLSLLDGYVEARFSPAFRVRGGKFKAPVGLERLQSPSDIAFVERGFPTQLLPNRDVGFQLSGDVLDGRLGYALGWFNGVPDNSSGDTDNNTSKDFAARVFAHPFRTGDNDWLRGLGVGVAATGGNQTGNAALGTYLTPGLQRFFQYEATASAAGSRQRVSPQLYWYAGPFSLLAEYATNTQGVSRSGVQKDLTHTAWQIYGTWVLTGEDASYTRVTPRQPFDSANGQWGAFEVGLRLQQLSLDDDAFTGTAATRLADIGKSARRATAAGVVLNWYLNRNIKIQADYNQTRFVGGAAGGRDLDDEHVVIARLQAAF